MGLWVGDCPSCGEYAQHEGLNSEEARRLEGVPVDEMHWKCQQCDEVHTEEELKP